MKGKILKGSGVWYLEGRASRLLRPCLRQKKMNVFRLGWIKVDVLVKVVYGLHYNRVDESCGCWLIRVVNVMYVNGYVMVCKGGVYDDHKLSDRGL